ncbi:MAG: TniB family NTP-binding protein [Microthrixaceae bacterium]
MVRREITYFPHLLPKVKDIAERSAAERIASLETLHWIGYPRAQAVVARLGQLFTQPEVIRPTNLLIVGPSNNGKSMIAERFRRMHPPRESTDGNHQDIPVIIMQMPTTPSIRQFYAALLAALGSPVIAPGTDMREQLVLRIMRLVGVRLLVIDELHNLLSGSPRQQREFLNLLRFLGNELRVPLACLGTKDAYLAIRSDDQLENRFEPMLLPRWSDDTDLARLLTSFEASLPLREPSGLNKPAMRALILNKSEGTIGEMAALLTAAARFAMRQGCESIDSQVIKASDYRSPSERRRQFESAIA